MSRERIHRKIRKTVIGTAKRPRLAVYRSLNNISVQLIDDSVSKTLASASSLKLSGSLTAKAEIVAKEIAKKAKENKISNVVFDRGGFAYLGAVKVLCETVRKEGIKV